MGKFSKKIKGIKPKEPKEVKVKKELQKLYQKSAMSAKLATDAFNKNQDSYCNAASAFINLLIVYELNRRYHFGKQRIHMFMEEFVETMDCLGKRRVSLDEIIDYEIRGKDKDIYSAKWPDYKRKMHTDQEIFDVLPEVTDRKLSAQSAAFQSVLRTLTIRNAEDVWRYAEAGAISVLNTNFGYSRKRLEGFINAIRELEYCGVDYFYDVIIPKVKSLDCFGQHDFDKLQDYRQALTLSIKEPGWKDLLAG